VYKSLDSHNIILMRRLMLITLDVPFALSLYLVRFGSLNETYLHDDFAASTFFNSSLKLFVSGRPLSCPASMEFAT
jgi:hypothetical protein